jgi:hypothetical protein
MPEALAASLLCIDNIYIETLEGIDVLEGWTGNAASKGAGTTGPTTSGTEIEQLRKHLDVYVSQLKQIARLGPGRLRKQLQLAQWGALNSLSARVCAVIRAATKVKQHPAPAEIIRRAEWLNVWRPLTETVIARWAQKPEGGYRLIVRFGPRRTAQCLMVRDVLSVMGIDSEFDFTRKGAGGEQALVKRVCDLITDDYNWWWTPDIKNCFPSIKPGHFGWLPIDRRLLKNVMFLPKCAKVAVVIPDDHGALLHGLRGPKPDLTVSDPIHYITAFTIQMVRQGLPQGSVLSPLLARAFVGRGIRMALADTGAIGLSFIDDLTIGACNRLDAKAAQQAVTKRFSSLSAGPIELHASPILPSSSGKVTVLGYRLEPGNGYGDNPVHVKPGRKRTNRFKRKLAGRLASTAPGNDLGAVAKEYWRKWFKSQQAWTKVPFHSADLSEFIAMTYVDDFKTGIPMGTWQVNNPKFTAASFA